MNPWIKADLVCPPIAVLRWPLKPIKPAMWLAAKPITGQARASGAEISQHEAGPAGAADAVAEFVGGRPCVGTNTHLIERPHAPVAVLRREQGRRLIADHAAEFGHRARIHRHREVAIESSGQ